MKKILFAFLTILIVSCNQSTEITSVKENAVKNSEHITQAVLWYQKSGEMVALYYQGYNFARIMLDSYLKTSNRKNKKAVIVDIDETILNNSPYEGWLIKNDSVYSKGSWMQWVEKSSADTIPGALDFLNYAKSKGVEVFYISNRGKAEIEPTKKNLNSFNFPFVDDNHLLFKTEKGGSKESRRLSVAKDYEIILLCGDNLADFSSAFDDRAGSAFADSVIKHKAEFGKKFIMLPNPMYGDWDRPFYSKKDTTSAQRDSIRKSLLIGY
jgi:5'-nucleotidase (lipoprotein e(P4) family)